MPGISLKPVFAGKPLVRERSATLTEFLWEGAVHPAIRSRDWKLMEGPHGRELYHIADDPHEFKNLAADGTAAPHAAELEDACLEKFVWPRGITRAVAPNSSGRTGTRWRCRTNVINTSTRCFRSIHRCQASHDSIFCGILGPFSTYFDAMNDRRKSVRKSNP